MKGATLVDCAVAHACLVAQAIVYFKSRAMGGLGRPHSRTRLRAAAHRLRRALAFAKSLIIVPSLAIHQRLMQWGSAS